MAKTGLHLGGRPYLVAQIPSNGKWRLALQTKFHHLVRSLPYQEIMAISRYYDIHYNTVYNWKYGRTFPSAVTMKEVIDWVTLGKPMRKVQPGSKIVRRGMF